MYTVRTAVGCEVTKLDVEEIGCESVYYIKLWLLRKGALVCGVAYEVGNSWKSLVTNVCAWGSQRHGVT
jgi:hypothetical protein